MARIRAGCQESAEMRNRGAQVCGLSYEEQDAQNSLRRCGWVGGRPVGGFYIFFIRCRCLSTRFYGLIPKMPSVSHSTDCIVMDGVFLIAVIGSSRAGLACPSRYTRIFRDPPCVLVRGEQQRQRVCRALGQHTLLQHTPGRRNVVRPLLDHRPGPRDGRCAGGRAARAGIRRNDPARWPEQPALALQGDAGVNVLKLNLTLDAASGK